MFKISALHSDGLPKPQRYFAVAAMALGTWVNVIDTAAFNAALPAIAADLKVSSAASVLLANVYQFAVVVALFPLAAIGDRLGFRRIYVSGLTLLALASISCALAPNFTVLAVAKFVQGLAAAGLMSVSSGLIRHIYPEHRLGQGIGIQGSIVAIGGACGPVFAAIILSVTSWRWMFALAPLLSAASIALALRALPPNPTTRTSFDVRGAALSAATLGQLVIVFNAFTFVSGFPLALLLIASMTMTAAALVRHEARVPVPLLPIDLMRRPVFSLSIGTAACAFIAQMLMLVTIPFFLHEHVGLSVAAAGFCLAPWPLAAAFTGPIAGSLADRYSAGRLGGMGLALVCAGAVLVALSPEQASVADILWRVAVCGAGFGFFQSPNNRLIISSTPKRRTSAAGALIGTVRLTGQMIGASVAALTFALAASHGKTVALYIAAGIALCAAGLSLTRVVAEHRSDGEALSSEGD